ncbi:hypothetical protein JKP88DRAFT_255486 [Tribonema minus]|uniref:Uncharacterized protein n=1 Tax=Tribonema minus TaxID=303371 RepID=A0A835YZN8_9STRA|nr:hypothetical protein JKP88DRAFT_255486 [Tribonema minus]
MKDYEMKDHEQAVDGKDDLCTSQWQVVDVTSHALYRRGLKDGLQMQGSCAQTGTSHCETAISDATHSSSSDVISAQYLLSCPSSQLSQARPNPSPSPSSALGKAVMKASTFSLSTIGRVAQKMTEQQQRLRRRQRSSAAADSYAVTDDGTSPQHARSGAHRHHGSPGYDRMLEDSCAAAAVDFDWATRVPPHVVPPIDPSILVDHIKAEARAERRQRAEMFKLKFGLSLQGDAPAGDAPLRQQQPPESGAEVGAGGGLTSQLSVGLAMAGGSAAEKQAVFERLAKMELQVVRCSYVRSTKMEQQAAARHAAAAAKAAELAKTKQEHGEASAAAKKELRRHALQKREAPRVSVEGPCNRFVIEMPASLAPLPARVRDSLSASVRSSAESMAGGTSCCTLVVEGACCNNLKKARRNNVDTARVALVMRRIDAMYRGLSAAIHGALASTVRGASNNRIRPQEKAQNFKRWLLLLLARAMKLPNMVDRLALASKVLYSREVLWQREEIRKLALENFWLKNSLTQLRSLLWGLQRTVPSTCKMCRSGRLCFQSKECNFPTRFATIVAEHELCVAFIAAEAWIAERTRGCFCFSSSDMSRTDSHFVVVGDNGVCRVYDMHRGISIVMSQRLHERLDTSLDAASRGALRAEITDFEFLRHVEHPNPYFAHQSRFQHYNLHTHTAFLELERFRAASLPASSCKRISMQTTITSVLRSTHVDAVSSGRMGYTSTLIKLQHRY